MKNNQFNCFNASKNNQFDCFFLTDKGNLFYSKIVEYKIQHEGI